jgi:hypothetical protein
VSMSFSAMIACARACSCFVLVIWGMISKCAGRQGG